jgi:hypothetical protein
VRSVTVQSYDAATTYSLTVNGHVASTIAAGSVNATATALAAAWNALTAAEAAGITADDDTDDIVLTADVAGVPFAFTPSVSGGTGTISAASVVTAATSANHWDEPINWSLAAIPVDGDDVVFDNSDVGVYYGIDQNGVALASLVFADSYTGPVGLPRRNAGGYAEYREQYLKIRPGTLTIGGTSGGRGSGRIKVNAGSAAACTVNVLSTGSPLETGIPAFLFIGTHANNVANVTKGDAGFAFFGGEAATLATLRMGYRTSVDGDARVWGGSGLTLGAVEKQGGLLRLEAGLTTFEQRAGETTLAAGSVTTLTADGGSVYYLGTGTITTLNHGPALVDFSRDLRDRTVTNANIYKGAKLRDPTRSVTWTNGIDLVRCSPKDVELDIGTHLTLTPSNI